jgi:hypothetical protein
MMSAQKNVRPPQSALEASFEPSAFFSYLPTGYQLPMGNFDEPL